MEESVKLQTAVNNIIHRLGLGPSSFSSFAVTWILHCTAPSQGHDSWEITQISTQLCSIFTADTQAFTRPALLAPDTKCDAGCKTHNSISPLCAAVIIGRHQNATQARRTAMAPTSQSRAGLFPHEPCWRNMATAWKTIYNSLPSPQFNTMFQLTPRSSVETT